MTPSDTPATRMLREMLAEIGSPSDPAADPSSITVQSLELDSLSVLELLMLIEDRAGVEIPVESIEAETSLLDIANRLSPPPAG